MTAADTPQPVERGELGTLASRLTAQPDFQAVARALTAAQLTSIDGAWGSAAAMVVAALSSVAPSTVLVILPREKELDAWALDVQTFAGVTPLLFPAWEMLPEELRMSDPILGSRLRVVKALESAIPPRIVIGTMQALLQPVPSRQRRAEATQRWRVGDTLDLDAISTWLQDRGFERVPAVEMPGEFSLRGGILDVFSPDASDPVRIELFGDEIDSLRTFSVETQQKIEELREITLTLISPIKDAAEPGALPNAGTISGSAGASPSRNETDTLRSDGENLLASLPNGAWVVLQELDDLQAEGKLYLQRLDDRRGLFSVEATFAQCHGFGSVQLAGLVANGYETTCHLKTQSIERFTRPKSEALAELAEAAGRDETILIACHNEAARERLTELINESAPELVGRVQLGLGHVSHGFRLLSSGATGSASVLPIVGETSEEKTLAELVAHRAEADGEKSVADASGSLRHLIVLSDNELFSRTEVVRAPRKKRLESRAIDSFLDLAEGDLIVHLSHGIGRYRGMKLLEKEGQTEEHLHLEFKDAVKLFVPVTLIHLVQKYVGGGKSTPELSKVGGTGWAKKKQKVAEAVSDMASDMIRLQAERDSKPGLACPPDSHWQQEFDAAFPYTETDDQLRAIADLKGDMMLPRPMDRLICGDVGYGKTEVAMRAVFKAVDAGRQAAVLVPTTVLAEQHFRSFSERMAEFPVTIASLSRFKTKGEQKEVIEGLAAGTIDIVIGTHRIVSPDMRFKDLGLLVIDEEQRFGVEAKETLKKFRLEIDVLTLSATPIPRTLHLSLLGVRDISNLETPPQDRMAVETRVCRFDGELIRHAIVREMNRGGQIYFVHNRIFDIESIADRLLSLVPEAKIDIVHGQMHEDELEPAMVKFVKGETDILVATTIIESGLDIPNANTIFIHQAENYGLSDLHQLRGRVGRYKHRAYCYLLLSEGKTLTSTAARRLKAIEEFSELGAGFKIALRDLEIRGAGNILGTEQSGHIASVGYELYCQLLENAVRALKREPMREHRHVAVDLPISAYLPPEYVPSGRPKIEMYRKVTSVTSQELLDQVREEFRDRFGPVPEPVEALIAIRSLQIDALAWHIDDIHLEDEWVVLGYRNPRKMQKLLKQSPHVIRVVSEREAYVPLPPKLNRKTEILGFLKSILQSKPVEGYNTPLVITGEGRRLSAG